MSDILIATRKGLFRLRDGAVHAVGFLGVPVTNVVRDGRDGRLHVAVDHGHFGCKLHHSDDDGATWVETDDPAYPQPADGDRIEVDPVRGEPVQHSTSLIWALEPGHPDDTDAMWCGTIPGGLFRSTDRGESWQLVTSLWDEPSRPNWFGGGYDHPGIHSISIDPTDPDTVAVGVSCGGTWVSHDRGASWTVATGMRATFLPPESQFDPYTQDPHRIVRCRDEPQTMWTQHHCGMFRSIDGGATWTEITDVDPSTFGFAVAAHPGDPNTAWFVPAISDEVRVPVDGNVVVNRTSDGGRTFDTFSSGLPQGNAWHLTYRHALAVDATGEQLVFGSTTGGLWSSVDAGEHWEQISNDLPPVHAVAYI